MNYDQRKNVFLPSAEKYVAMVKNYQNGAWNADHTIFTVKVHKLGYEGYSITVRQDMVDVVFVIWMDVDDKVSVEIYATQYNTTEEHHVEALKTVINYIACSIA